MRDFLSSLGRGANASSVSHALVYYYPYLLQALFWTAAHLLPFTNPNNGTPLQRSPI